MAVRNNTLQIIQSVMTTVVSSDTGAFDLIQRFRVPARARLRWIEVAFGVAPHPTYFDPIMAIARPLAALLTALGTGTAVNWLVRRKWDGRGSEEIAAGQSGLRVDDGLWISRGRFGLAIPLLQKSNEVGVDDFRAVEFIGG